MYSSISQNKRVKEDLENDDDDIIMFNVKVPATVPLTHHIHPKVL